MSVTVSKTHNLVTDLSDMFAQGKTPKVYFTLFENKNDIQVLKEALAVVGLAPEGGVQDEGLLALRHVSVRERIGAFMNKCGYPCITPQALAGSTEPLVIVVKNDIRFFGKIKHYFEQQNVNCYLGHFTHIRDTAVVNGTERVINRISYLNSWPWFLDILNKDMPEADREGFDSKQVSGRVLSNGEFYLYEDMQTKYSELKNGFRKVTGYRPIEGKKKYNVTMIGDSRFVNSFVPTELTLANYLQKRFMAGKLNCEVRNLSVRANVIQNEFAALRNLSVGPEDIILCSTCPVGEYYDFKVKEFDDLRRVRVRIMYEMTQYCHERGAEIFFVYHPYLKDIPNLTKLEQHIADSYGLTYAPDRSHDRMKQLAMSCGVKVIDLTENIINTERTCFFVDYSHFSPEGSRCIAGVLAGYVRTVIERDRLLDDPKITQLTQDAYEAHRHYAVDAQYKGMWDYLQELHRLSEGKPEHCGAIVMNCNPFTLGHRYLIETARAQVDHLYILAVEEDRSVFKFKDRIEMMRRGVADLPGVEVIPSGKFVISALTFPEYFEKGALQDETIDTTTDIEIFCTKIAPALHIKTRFVGEEPLDRVTNQYNMRMKEMLPEYGMQLIEIKRKESGEAVISASRVRKLLQEKQYDEVKKLVPQTTYDYLIGVLGF
ncbi:MAG: adenylyltransferase/cytidyltransferase family protein [Oscillospiraceae bacterium]|nr:adenylyltransferase/cytidyltransferase family protein [Oscillospiraceae bacterium]